MFVDYNASTPGVTPNNTSENPRAAVFQCVDCIDSLDFHTKDLDYDLTMDTVFTSGKTYYTKNGNSYSKYTGWTAGSPMPEDTYYESCSGRTGFANGNSKYAESNIHRWLNAEQPTNSWFTRLYCGDTCSYKAKDGFLYGMEQALKDNLITVKRKEHQNNAMGRCYCLYSLQGISSCRL